MKIKDITKVVTLLPFLFIGGSFAGDDRQFNDIFYNLSINSKPPPVYPKDIPVDIFGRPLKDSQGRWITYSVEKNYGWEYPPPSTPVYDRSESDMDSANKADHYRQRYLRSGRTTDLIMFRNEFGRAINHRR